MNRRFGMKFTETKTVLKKNLAAKLLPGEVIGVSVLQLLHIPLLDLLHQVAAPEQIGPNSRSKLHWERRKTGYAPPAGKRRGRGLEQGVFPTDR